MQTKDIVKTGIDRSFLRQCVSKRIITPVKEDDKWKNQKYLRQDFSQEDLEKVWNAYMCRQIGLSYGDIISLQQGNSISLRSSLNELIQKYQNKIAELQTLIQFMKYVKGIGFIPSPPEISLGSESFTQYLKDYISYLDEDGKALKTLTFIEQFSEINDFDSISDEELDKMQTVLNEINPSISSAQQEECGKIFISFRENANMNPESDEIQNLVHRYYCCIKEFGNNLEMTPREYAEIFFYQITSDSDMGESLRNLLGKEGSTCFKEALLYYWIKHKED